MCKMLVKGINRSLRLFLLLIVGMFLFSAWLELFTITIIGLLSASMVDANYILNNEFLMKIFNLMPAFEPTQLNLVVFLCIVIIGLCLIKGAVNCIQAYCEGRFSGRLGEYMGEEFLDKILHAEYEWFNTKEAADVQRAFGHRIPAAGIVGSTLLRLISDVVVSCIIIIGVLALTPPITLLYLVGVGIVIALYMAKMKKVAQKTVKSYNQLMIDLGAITSTVTSGMREVKIYHRLKMYWELFVSKNRKLAAAEASRVTVARVTPFVLEALGFSTLCVYIIVLITSGYVDTAMLTGTLTMVVISAWRILPLINRSCTMAIMLLQTSYMLEECFPELPKLRNVPLEHEPEENEPPFDFKLIELVDVDYRYSEKSPEVLHNLNLSIKRGERLGVIGKSGGGKTTLITLLTGLFKSSKGQMLVDGVVINAENVMRWRKTMGYVGQAPYIPGGSMGEAIAFSFRDSDEYNEPRVFQAAQMAGIDFMDSADSNLAENAVNLSGGQKQRVAIARALYRNCKLIILDEATSSLDFIKEQHLKKTIHHLPDDVTIVIVAHRLTTIDECERVLWIDEGRVRMQGKPDEVIAAYYASGGTDGEL